MKDVISYLKLDLRISKRTLLMMIPALIFMVYMFFAKKVYIFGMTYLLLILVLCTTMPFNKISSEKLGIMYNVFPVRVSKMVLGRFIYLILWILIIFAIETMLMIYLYGINKIDNREIITMCLCEIVVIIACFIECLVCYRFESRNGVIISLLYTIPGMVLFALGSFLVDNKFISTSQADFIISNKNIVIMLSGFIIILTAYISYLVSCRICKRKEV